MATLPTAPTLAFRTLQESPSTPIFVLVGPPKHGKTQAILSASPKYDIKAPAMIDDVALISFDNGALDGPKSMGFDLKYWLDLSGYTDCGEVQFNKMLDEALAMIKQLAVEKKIVAVGIDPISTLDKIWKAYLTKTYEKWALLDQLLVKHRRFVMEKLIAIPVPKILTFHTKTVGQMDETKRQALGIEAGDVQTIDVSGWEAPGLYRAQNSLFIPIKKTEGKGGKPDEFFLYPKGVNGIEAGGRYPILNTFDKLPANLAEVFRLIRSGK
jgi:hypothetical protein